MRPHVTANASLMLALLSCLFPISTAWSSPAAIFYEIGARNPERPLRDGAIIDINGCVRMSVDRDALRESAAQLSGSSRELSALAVEYVRLARAVQAGVEALRPLDEELKTFAASDRSDAALARVSESIAALADPGVAVLRAIKGTSAYAKFTDSLGRMNRPTTTEQYSALFSIVSEFLDRQRKRLDDSLTTQGVYVQAGAWLRRSESDRPIHLAGFDTYPQGEDYVVPRWLVAPDSQARRDYDQAAAISRSIQLGTLMSELRSGLETLVRTHLASAGQCMQALDSAATLARARIGEQAGDLRAEIDRAHGLLTDDRTWLNSMLVRWNGANGSGTTSLEGLPTDLEELARRLSDVSEEATRLRAAARSAVSRFPGLRQDLLALAEQAGTICLAEFQQKRQAAIDLASKVESALGLEQQNQRILEFSEKVLRLDIANVPEHTELALRRTGYRTDGDQIVFRMRVGNSAGATREVADASFDLYRVFLHLEWMGGMVFAHADSSHHGRATFRPAPAYSLLVKGWFFGADTRRPTYQRLWDPGFGLSLASLDFNHDDQQELGIGFQFSTLLDIVQLGYGYNATLGTGYSFFGLRIPLPLSVFSGVRTEPSEVAKSN